MTQTHVAHFSVTGEALTDLARDFFLSDMPPKAWRFLCNALVGDDQGQVEMVAREVLDGKKRLTGDSDAGIDFEDDDAPGYVKNIRHIYAGRVRIAGMWFRPRAEVVSGGQYDGDFASKKVARISDGAGGVSREFAIARVEYHCRAGERVVEVEREVSDVLHREKAKKRRKASVTDFVIFEPCPEPPFWWPEHRDASAALADFLSAGRRLRRLEGESPLEPLGSIAKKAQAQIDEAEARQRRAEEDAREEAKHQKYLERLAGYAKEIRERAGDDTFELTTKSGRVITVPRAPFWNWALHRTSLKHLAPEWTPVCPSGLKLPFDDEYHSDWMLGAGLDLADEYHDREIRDASWEETYRIQTEVGEFEAAVIIPGNGNEVRGKVGQLIAVVPDLEQDKVVHVNNALAIITETGGPLAHIAILAIEREVPIFLVPDAVRRFPPGTVLTLRPDTGEIHVEFERT